MASDPYPFPEPATHDATVIGRRLLTPRVLSLELRVAGEATFGYREGQYIRIHLADGRRRDLSIANPCAGDNLVELWARDVGGDFSRYLFDHLEIGERWRFDGPLGEAWVPRDGRPLLIVSGGTGLGPARAIVRGELARDPSRPIELIHGDASATELFAGPELEHRAREHPSFTYLPTLEQADAAWEGHRGTPDRVVAERHSDLRGWSAHLFGPPPMVDAVRPLLEARGLTAESIHADAFTPGASDLDRTHPPRS